MLWQTLIRPCVAPAPVQTRLQPTLGLRGSIRVRIVNFNFFSIFYRRIRRAMRRVSSTGRVQMRHSTSYNICNARQHSHEHHTRLLLSHPGVISCAPRPGPGMSNPNKRPSIPRNALHANTERHHRARLRAHGRNAPRGVRVRPRHHTHRPGNDRHPTAARAKSRAPAPRRPARAAATAARSTTAGRRGRCPGSISIGILRQAHVRGNKEGINTPRARTEVAPYLMQACQWARGAAPGRR